jgi:hypothetical protein
LQDICNEPAPARHAARSISASLAMICLQLDAPPSIRPKFTLYAIMAKSISVKRKKVGRPATGTEPLYGVRISDDLMGRIEKWAEENSATRSEAIRRLVDLGLRAKAK